MENTRELINNLNFLTEDWDIYEDLNGYDVANPYEDIGIYIPRYVSDFMLIDVWCSWGVVGSFNSLLELENFICTVV